MQGGKESVVPLEGEAVKAGEADVRGWDVVAGDGTRIGEVDDLLVDRAAGEVRFLDVTVTEALVRDADTTQHVLVPVGSARLEGERDRVVVDGLTRPGLLLEGERREADADEGGGGRRGGGRRDQAAPLVERERAILHLEPARPQSDPADAPDPSRGRG